MKTQKKYIRAVTVVLCAILVFLACFALVGQNKPVSAAGTTTQKQISSLENKLADFNKDAIALKRELSSKQGQVASLESQIASLDRETTLLTSQITTMDTLIEQWTLLSEEKKAEITELEKQQAEEQKVFDNMLRMSYEYGSDTYFNLIFGSESIGDFLSRVDLITYHLKYNNNVLENLANTKKSLEKTRGEYDYSLTSLGDYKVTQEDLKAELEVKIEQTQRKKQELMKDAQQTEEQYNKKLAEAQQIAAEIKALYEQQERERREAEAKGIPYNSGGAATGVFQYPLPLNYTRISSGFVNRISPITGKRENHNGLDLPDPRGTHIYAADGGTVVIGVTTLQLTTATDL